MHNYMFFETTATIIALVLLGNVMEHHSIPQTAVSLGELSKMQTATARVVMRLNGKEKLSGTDPKNIKAGDELQVNEDDHVPTDGIILSGSALVDESAITGESAHVKKDAGSPVFSGTTLVSGNVRMEAQHESRDSTLQKIIDLIKKARKDQPQIQKVGHKVSSIFVPVVVVISLLTLVVAYFIFSNFFHASPDECGGCACNLLSLRNGIGRTHRHCSWGWPCGKKWHSHQWRQHAGTFCAGRHHHF